MSLAAFACGPKDTQIRIVQATDTPPPVAGAKINAERTQTPTVLPTLAPEIPVIHDSKSDTPTATPTAAPGTPTPEARPTGTQAPVEKAPTPVPTPAKTATPRPTATRTPEPTPTKTPQELDSIFRQQLEAAINQYFFEVNHRNLSVDPVLSNYAQTCAGFMAEVRPNAHVCKDQPGIIRIITSGWRGGRVEENIAWASANSLSFFMNFWKTSVTHNTAMINNNNKFFGVGCSSSPKTPTQDYEIDCVAVFGQ